MAKVECPECGNDVTVTKGGLLYKHGTGGVECCASGERAPGEKLPPPPQAKGCTATPGLHNDGCSCPADPIPGADEYAASLAEANPPMVDVTSLPAAEPASPPVPTFSQPALPFSQPARQAKVLTQAKPMTELGSRIASELKQMFFQYNNRDTEDNRSAQRTLGPSEIGTPCDRRLALSLLRFPPVNSGGDGWAAFVGTCVHEGVANMLQWADGSTGRYAVEIPLQFPSEYVPRGTGDWLDRVLLIFNDHKMMGQWSLDKLKTDGPSRTYLVQVNVYAYGARMRGDKVQSVGIIGWPRDKNSLDDLYVWTDDYRPEIAREALDRVGRIAARVLAMQGEGASPNDIGAAAPFDRSDCKFCPFHMAGAAPLKEGGVGCNGRQ